MVRCNHVYSIGMMPYCTFSIPIMVVCEEVEHRVEELEVRQPLQILQMRVKKFQLGNHAHSPTQASSLA